MVALVGGEHDSGVGRVDPVVGQALEERREGGVIGGKVLLVAGISRALGGAAVGAPGLAGYFDSCASEM